MKEHNVNEEIRKFAMFLKENKTVEELLNQYKMDEEYMFVKNGLKNCVKIQRLRKYVEKNLT